MNNNNVTYFDSFRVEHIPKEIKLFINCLLPSASQNKNIKTNIFRIQAYDSIMCGYFCIGFIDFMLKRKILTEYTNLFSPNNFKKNDDIILNYFMSNILKMDDFSKTPNIYPTLNVAPLNVIPSNKQEFRLNKINEIKDYFLTEIRERELISKNISKYIASLDYFDKSLNLLSILSASISIASFATVIGTPAGIIGASCGFTFSITSGFVKRFLKTIRNKKKKHNKTIMLARHKLNSIESKISKALIDKGISHEDFETIINEKKNIEN